MEKIALIVEKRQNGKGISRRLRAAGKIPGVLYGRSVEPISVVVDEVKLEKIVRGKAGMNVMLDLQVADGDSGLAVIRDYQADPFRREFWHVDFQAISANEKISIEVPVEVVGTSIGVKEGGVMEILRRSLQVKAMPESIPTSIKIDVTELKINDSIHQNQVKLPDGVEFQSKLNHTVLAVLPPIKIVESAPIGVAGVDGAVPAEGAAAAADGAAPAEGAAAPAAEKDAKKKD